VVGDLEESKEFHRASDIPSGEVASRRDCVHTRQAYAWPMLNIIGEVLQAGYYSSHGESTLQCALAVRGCSDIGIRARSCSGPIVVSLSAEAQFGAAPRWRLDQDNREEL